MIDDVVLWSSEAMGCNRCGARAKYYINPYYQRGKRICPVCVVELNRHFDEHGWPPSDRCDR